MTHVVITAAEPADLPEIGRIAVDAYRADGQLDGGVDGHYGKELADAARRARDSELLVAKDSATGAVLGSVAVCRHGTPLAEISRPAEFEFRMLAVDPPAQGRGVGKALVDACVERARRSGARAVVICTRAGFSARHMYEAMGFVRIPERDWTPIDDVHLIALSLPLTDSH